MADFVGSVLVNLAGPTFVKSIKIGIVGPTGPAGSGSAQTITSDDGSITVVTTGDTTDLAVNTAADLIWTGTQTFINADVVLFTIDNTAIGVHDTLFQICSSVLAQDATLILNRLGQANARSNIKLTTGTCGAGVLDWTFGTLNAGGGNLLGSDLLFSSTGTLASNYQFRMGKDGNFEIKSGDLFIPTGAGANKVLTSDSSGHGTWQSLSGVVTSVDTGDSSLVISPTTGDVLARINYNHIGHWIANQAFLSLQLTPGAQLGYGLISDNSGLASWAPIVNSVTNVDGSIFVSLATGNAIISLDPSKATTWTTSQKIESILDTNFTIRTTVNAKSVDLVLDRHSSAGAKAELNFQTNGTPDWYVGTYPGSTNLGFSSTGNSSSSDAQFTMSKAGKLTTAALQVTGSPTSGYVLTADSSGNATWQATASGSSGTVTSVATGTGLTGGTITTTGTLSIDTAWAGQAAITTVGTIATGTWAGTTIAVNHGGTGQVTLAAHGVLIGNGTSGISVTGTGSAGQILVSNGASADPTFQSASTVLSVTTKGDLQGFSTTPARVAVGSDTQVLTADSSAATGVSWQSPVASTDAISSVYPIFTPAGSDDEFSGGSFTGWTAVNSGSHLPTLTQSNNVLSVNMPGSDALAEWHAWMKSPTITTNSYVQIGFNGMGFAQNYNSCGVLFADGTSYGSGAQACFYWSANEACTRMEAHTNYSTQGTSNTDLMQVRNSDIHLKLVYNGSNSWTGLISPDGISFVTVRTQTITLTPTKAGFFVSTQSGTKAFAWSIRYVRFG